MSEEDYTAYYKGQRDMLEQLVDEGILTKLNDVTGYYVGEIFIPIYPNTIPNN